MIDVLKRHSWFFAAAGICSWVAAGLPLVIRLLSPTEPVAYITPTPHALEIVAFLIFGIALAAVILDRNPSAAKRWILLCIQSVAMLVMGLKLGPVVIFPLLVLIAWQATLMLSFRGALAWLAAQTAVLWIMLLPTWNNLACLFTLGIFPAVQLFGVFAARLAQAEAAHAHDMTQMNVELRATRALLASTVLAEERARISRELHDAWGHHLTALNLQLEYASHLATGTLRESLEEAKGLSRALLAKVRDVVETLRVEEGCGIAHMLQELVADLPPRPAVHCKVSQDVQVRSSAHAQAVLRCVQEAVTNAIKHACASNVWIDIYPDEGGIRIAVRDDGRGAEPVTHGNGLNGMRDRFEELGGRLAIDSKANAGFSLEGWLPHGATAT